MNTEENKTKSGPTDSLAGESNEKRSAMPELKLRSINAGKLSFGFLIKNNWKFGSQKPRLGILGESPFQLFSNESKPKVSLFPSAHRSCSDFFSRQNNLFEIRIKPLITVSFQLNLCDYLTVEKGLHKQTEPLFELCEHVESNLLFNSALTKEDTRYYKGFQANRLIYKKKNSWGTQNSKYRINGKPYSVDFQTNGLLFSKKLPNLRPYHRFDSKLSEPEFYFRSDHPGGISLNQRKLTQSYSETKHIHRNVHYPLLQYSPGRNQLLIPTNLVLKQSQDVNSRMHNNWKDSGIENKFEKVGQKFTFLSYGKKLIRSPNIKPILGYGSSTRIIQGKDKKTPNYKSYHSGFSFPLKNAVIEKITKMPNNQMQMLSNTQIPGKTMEIRPATRERKLDLAMDAFLKKATLKIKTNSSMSVQSTIRAWLEHQRFVGGRQQSTYKETETSINNLCDLLRSTIQKEHSDNASLLRAIQSLNNHLDRITSYPNSEKSHQRKPLRFIGPL